MVSLLTGNDYATLIRALDLLDETYARREVVMDQDDEDAWADLQHDRQAIRDTRDKLEMLYRNAYGSAVKL
jgi:hypothetical protein